MKLKPNFVIIIGLLLVFLLTGSAIAERYVVVNGQRLTIHQIQYFAWDGTFSRACNDSGWQ